MKHYVYKCRVKELLPWHYLITAYSCSDFYIKRSDERRARRVKVDYLRDCFPEWYKNCGLFHVKQNKKGVNE